MGWGACRMAGALPLRTVSKASSTLVESRAEVSKNSSPLFSDRKGSTPLAVEGQRDNNNIYFMFTMYICYALNPWHV